MVIGDGRDEEFAAKQVGWEVLVTFWTAGRSTAWRDAESTHKSINKWNRERNSQESL